MGSQNPLSSQQIAKSAWKGEFSALNMTHENEQREIQHTLSTAEMCGRHWNWWVGLESGEAASRQGVPERNSSVLCVLGVAAVNSP